MELKTVLSFALLGIALVLALLLVIQKPAITAEVTHSIHDESDELKPGQEKCTVRCYSSEDCDDSKEETTDICRYRGQCNSTCKHYKVNLIGSIS